MLASTENKGTSSRKRKFPYTMGWGVPMSEDNGTGKETAKGTLWSVINAVVSRGPALLLVVGVLLVLIAAVGKWQDLFTIDLAWRIIVAVLGGILISFGVWRTGPSSDQGEVLPDPKQKASYGVRITYPVNDIPTPVKNPGLRPYFEVRGKIKKRPRGAEIWVFVVGGDGRLWPHGPAEIKGEDWTVYEVYPGRGERKKIEAYLVGKNGKILIKYYKMTGREIWPIRDKIKEEYPNNKIKIEVPAITETTTDMVPCDDLRVTLANND